MDKKLNEVVILAGGFGTRLSSSLGNSIPKPMAKVNNIPILEHQINLCKKYSFKRILILVHHLSDVIKDYFEDGVNFGVEITYKDEIVPRGTAGAIFDAIDMLEDVFLVIYGDTFLNVDLKKFFKCKKQSFEVLTFCHPNSHPYDSDVLCLDEEDFVTDVFRPSKKEKQFYKNHVNAALYVMSKRVFSSIPSNRKKIDISSELFPIALKDGHKIKAYKSVEYIKDMGTPERYQKVQNDISNGIDHCFSNAQKRKCIFLDRDGVINKEVGHLSKIEDFEIIDGVEEAIKTFIKLGFIVICVTNQPVVARGEISFEELDEIHSKMETLLGEKGAYLNKIYFCPHHPDRGFKNEIQELKISCECRKPKPGMILQAINEFNIDPKESWMIGDDDRDIVAGKSAGLMTIRIDSNYVSSSQNNIKGIIAKDLFEASQFILQTN